MKLSLISVFLFAIIAATCNAAESASLRADDGDMDYIQEEDVAWTPEEEHRLLEKVEEAERMLQSKKCAGFQKKFAKKMARVLRYSSKTLQGFVCNPVNRNGPLKAIESKVKKELDAKDGDARRELKIVRAPCARSLELVLAAKEKKQKILAKKQSMKDCKASVAKEVQGAERMRRHLLAADDDMTDEERELWASKLFSFAKKAVKTGITVGRSFGWW